MKKRYWVLLASLWLLAGPAVAAVAVQTLYQKYCGTCHGDEGDGRGRAGVQLSPPATAFTRADPARLTEQYMLRIIRDGKPGTAMVGYGRRLSTEEIQALARFIRTRFVAPAENAAPAAGDPRLAAGKAIYVKHCAACHGDRGNTAVWARNGLNPPPRDFTRPEAREELSRERMITSVSYGRPGTAMMPFRSRLSRQEIEQVVDYVRKAFMGLGTDGDATASAPVATSQESPPMVDMDQPMPGGLQGDVARGRAFYQQNCFTCHGRKGDGRGPRAHFNYPRPRDFTSADSRSRFNRPRLFRAIAQGKRGSVMPAWQRVLDAQQIADVAEYVFQTFIRAETEKKSPS